MTERVLVTGASGFVGHHLVRTLVERGQAVTCLVRPTSDISDLQRMGAEFATAEFGQSSALTNAMRGADFVYHLAGATTARSAAEFSTVNTGGVERVARAAAANEPAPTLVMLSSLAAAGPNPNGPAVETHTPAPVSDYGRSKLGGEEAARRYADRVAVTIVRAPWVFGERDADTLKIFRMVRQGLLLVPVPASNSYSMVHATDLSDGLIRAAGQGERASREPGSGLYYVAAPELLTYEDIGRMIGASMGRDDLRVIYAPGGIVRATATVADLGMRALGRAPDIINLDKAKEGRAGSWACSPARAEAQLGFAPLKSLPDRMRQTANWYLEHGWL